MEKVVKVPAIEIHSGQTIDITILAIKEDEIGLVTMYPDPRKVPPKLNWQAYCVVVEPEVKSKDKVKDKDQAIVQIKLRLTNTERTGSVQLQEADWHLTLNRRQGGTD